MKNIRKINKNFNEVYKICKEICENPYNGSRINGWFIKKIIFNNRNYHIKFYCNNNFSNKLYYASGETSYVGGGEDLSNSFQKFKITITPSQKEKLVKLYEKYN